MKHTLIIAALLAATSSTAFAAKAGVGNCIYPKHDHVKLYQADRATVVGNLKMKAFSVSATAPGGWVQLTMVPDYSSPNPDAFAGHVAGWAHGKEFDQQDLRNCN